MGISLQLYEDSGPATLGRGTYRIATNNIGWKSDGTNEEGNHYAFSPVIRPKHDTDLWSRSFKKYHFAKIDGTYPVASRVRITITNSITGEAPNGESSIPADQEISQIRIFYKLTNTYEQPNDEWDGELRFVENGSVTLYPSVSKTGPEGTQEYPQYLQTYVKTSTEDPENPGQYLYTYDNTFYTQYLVTQLVVPAGVGFGNIGEVNILWFVDEYEDGNI